MRVQLRLSPSTDCKDYMIDGIWDHVSLKHSEEPSIALPIFCFLYQTSESSLEFHKQKVFRKTPEMRRVSLCCSL